MIKYEVGTIGKPKLKEGDVVGFYITPYRPEEEKLFVGEVYIVDKYGTFEQNEEPSYDILVPKWLDTGKPMLCKHVKESECYRIEPRELPQYLDDFKREIRFSEL